MLALTEIELSSEHESNRKISTGFAFPLYILLLFTPPPPFFTPSPTSYYSNMSQHDLHQIIRQQQEQLTAM